MNPVVPSLEDALRGAVETAKYQRGAVPALPSGWIEQAETALSEENAGAMSIAADTILLAHAQYRADFDMKGWLFDLRNAHDAECRIC